MAITDIAVSGKVFQDDGDPVAGATVQLIETGTSTVEATYDEGTGTGAAGQWAFTETSVDATYDVKITSGSSIRNILWSDEITAKGVDTASLKVRGVDGAAAPIYLFADRADQDIDVWRINAADGGTLTFDNRASGGSDSDLVSHMTITPNATVASSTVIIPGILDVNGSVDFDGTDVDIVSSGDIDLASTNNNAAAIYLRENAGTSGTIKIHADQGTGAGSIELLSDAGGIELDAGTDIILDAGGADIFLKDDGTLFGTFTNSSGELVIKSSASGTTAATFTGANVMFAGTVDATTDFTIGSTVITDDSIVMTPSTSDTVTIAGATHGILNVTTVDAAGTAADVNIDADGEIVIDAADAAGAIFKIAGTAQLSVIDGAILPTTDNDIDLGSGSYQFKDAYVNGTLEADAVTIGGTNVVTGSLVTTLGTISAGVWQGTAITGAYINDDIISGQAEITSGLAAADELLYSDAGTVKRVGVDTLTTYLAGVNAGTVTSTGLSDSSGVISLDIQNMTASSTIADADLIIIDDGAGGTLRKMTRANFIESAALDAINIDGGAIDGAVIGANSAAAGTFAAVAGTTGTFSGILKTDDSTAATSTTDGSLQTDGGLSVVGDAIIGDDLKLLSDSAVFAMGAGSDFTITHDGSTAATIDIGGSGGSITNVGSTDNDWTATGLSASGLLTLKGNNDYQYTYVTGSDPHKFQSMGMEHSVADAASVDLFKIIFASSQHSAFYCYVDYVIITDSIRTVEAGRFLIVGGRKSTTDVATVNIVEVYTGTKNVASSGGETLTVTMAAAATVGATDEEQYIIFSMACDTTTSNAWNLRWDATSLGGYALGTSSAMVQMETV